MENPGHEKLEVFCLSLSMANAEREVFKLLMKAGYWYDPTAWRYYDDNENNSATIGNQQRKPDSALVEKIISRRDPRRGRIG